MSEQLSTEYELEPIEWGLCRRGECYEYKDSEREEELLPLSLSHFALSVHVPVYLI